MTSLILSFYPVTDLVDGQRRARPQFAGQSDWLLVSVFWFCLSSERENGGRRRRNRRRKEIKEKLDNRLVGLTNGGLTMEDSQIMK